MEVTSATVTSLVAALAIGLLIGVERERRKGHGPARSAAGVRTHALLCLVGALAWLLDPRLLIAAAVGVAALAVVSYARSDSGDPGVTGEVTMMASLLLGAVAVENAALASGAGVVVAALLHTKRPLHRFTRDVLSQGELDDLLLLAAAVLVVWPLLPDRALDPWGALNPASLWKFVVLVMAIGAAGHVALRLVGARWGLPLAGFLSGFASSTAAVVGFGQRAKLTPAVRAPAAAAALLANLASHLLFVVVVGAGSLALLQATALPLAANCAVLLLASADGIWRAPRDAQSLPEESTARAIRVSWALTFGVAIATVLFVAAWLKEVFGDSGALVTAGIAALAELHASAATIAQLTASESLSLQSGRWGVVGLLVASGLVKTVLGFTSGGSRYGLRITAGVLGGALAAGLVVSATPV
jgi:uncharacterized membrane protein (DUF4010 family)